MKNKNIIRLSAILFAICLSLLCIVGCMKLDFKSKKNDDGAKNDGIAGEQPDEPSDLETIKEEPVKVVEDKNLTFATFEKKTEEELKSVSFEGFGPYKGAVRNGDDELLVDVYDESGENILATAPADFLLYEFFAYDEESVIENVNADFYYGKNDDGFEWIAAVSKPAFHQSKINVYAFMNGKVYWMYRGMIEAGVVYGVNFVSPTEGYILHDVPTVDIKKNDPIILDNVLNHTGEGIIVYKVDKRIYDN